MSTLSVTSINTATGTTDLSLATGNASAAQATLQSGGGFFLRSNSTTNVVTSSSSGNFVISNTIWVSAITGNVGIGNSTPAAELHIDGNYAVKSTTLSAGNNHNINCASGNYFVVVANSSAQNVYFTSAPSSVAYSATLRFSNGGGGNTISWANTPKWPSATAPTPSTNNDIWIFITDDGGTTWRGNLVQKDSR
jgi:hypothetical protein